MLNSCVNSELVRLMLNLNLISGSADFLPSFIKSQPDCLKQVPLVRVVVVFCPLFINDISRKWLDVISGPVFSQGTWRSIGSQRAPDDPQQETAAGVWRVP